MERLNKKDLEKVQGGNLAWYNAFINNVDITNPELRRLSQYIYKCHTDKKAMDLLNEGCHNNLITMKQRNAILDDVNKIN